MLRCFLRAELWLCFLIVSICNNNVIFLCHLFIFCKIALGLPFYSLELWDKPYLTVLLLESGSLVGKRWSKLGIRQMILRGEERPT